MVPLSFAGHVFDVVAPAALFWPKRQALLVADLHFEKASFYARQGQMLPPYDSRATLDELSELISHTSAKTVFCLGDNYHDNDGEARLERETAKHLKSLTGEVEWIWITGNHDRDANGLWGGNVMVEWVGDGLALRHEATKKPDTPELSGHYHPKIRVKVRGRHVSRRCFVVGEHNLILPAFGSLTGGMAAGDSVIEEIVGGPAEAMIGLSEKLLRFPLNFEQAATSRTRQIELPLSTNVD